MNYYRLLFTALCLFGVFTGFAQSPNITNADGSKLTDRYCYSDTDYEIIGTPPGGTFSGDAAVFERGGKFYINPVVATVGVTVFPISRNITYTPLPGEDNPVTKSLLMWKPVVISPPLVDTFTCDGEFYLNATTLYAGAYEYTWTPGVYLEHPDSNITKGMITSSQTFVITAVDNTSNCVGSDTISIDYKVISADVVVDKERICPSDTFQLTVTNPQLDYTYEWLDWGKGVDVGDSSILRYAISTPGDHRIDLQASNDKCSETISTMVHVVDVGLKLIATPDLTNYGSTVILTTQAAVPYQVINWYPTYLFPIQTLMSQSITVDSSRFYSAVARSTDGCLDSASVYVKVNPKILIPSAFSPNNDGTNDYFKPQGLGDDFRITLFQIFNRTGQLIYKSNAGSSAGGLKGWDGTIDGKQADVGVYFYYLEMLNNSGETIVEKGDITLVR